MGSMCNDLPVQLHFALFNGSGGYVLKPYEMKRAMVNTMSRRSSTSLRDRGSAVSDRGRKSVVNVGSRKNSLSVLDGPPSRKSSISEGPPSRKSSISGPPSRKASVSEGPPSRKGSVSEGPPSRKGSVSEGPPSGKNGESDKEGRIPASDSRWKILRSRCNVLVSNSARRSMDADFAARLEFGTADEFWPPPREQLHCTSIELLSLHNLPKRTEQRPRYDGSRGACHRFHQRELSGKAIQPDGLPPSSPAISVSLHPIGGVRMPCTISRLSPFLHLLPMYHPRKLSGEATQHDGLPLSCLPLAGRLLRRFQAPSSGESKQSG